MLNEQKKKKKKPVKRIIDCDKSGWNNTISIQYIIDSGNLIRDVQTRYNKTVKFKGKDYEKISYRMNNFIERCEKSKQRIMRDLEYQLMSSGATEYNAETTAKKLMVKYAVVRGR